MQTVSAIDTARRLQRERRFAESRLLWCQALESDPDLFVARLGAGNSCLGTGDWKEARSHFEVALKTRPNHIGGHVGLAKVASLRGEEADAATHWKNALDLKPEQEKFAFFHVESLIHSKHPDYRQALESYESQIVQIEGAYWRIAKALKEIQDHATECVFLTRLFLHKDTPPDCLRLLRGLVRLLWVNGENETGSAVLDAAWQRFGSKFVDTMVESSFATPLLPTEAIWLVANEKQLFDSNYHDALQMECLIARGYLWRGDKSDARDRYQHLKSELESIIKRPIDSSQSLDDPRRWGIFLESCIECGDLEMAVDIIRSISDYALGESPHRTEWIHLLLNIGQLVVADGPQKARLVACELLDQFVSLDDSVQESLVEADTAWFMALARLCIQTRLETEATLLHARLSPAEGHWLTLWVNRNNSARLLRDNAQSWVHGLSQPLPETVLAASPATSDLNPVKNRSASLSPSTSIPDQILPAGALPLFAKFKNEKHRLPAFLEYYRNMGVSHFFLIDNCSDDKASELLLDQSDVFLWFAKGSLEANAHCSPWINALIDKFAPAHWCLSVDLDEYLNFAGSDHAGSLQPFTERLHNNGEEFLPAFMLDMFPEVVTDIRRPKAHEALQELHPWFDNRYQFLGMNRAPYLQAVGGFRSRMWSGMCNDTLQKTPLFYSGNGVRLVNANHDTNGGVPSRHTGLLRHYRFSDDLLSRKAISDYISKTNTSFSAFDNMPPGHRLPDGCSVKYESSDQLLKLGLLDVW